MTLVRLFALCLLLVAPCASGAQSYPDHTRLTVNDYAGLIPDDTEAALDKRLSALRRDTGVEMTVLTLPRQSDYAPDMTVEAFATALFNHWGIGDASRNDGILVLILRDDRAMRIELGAGYGHDWDRAAASVINRSFLPAFEKDDYAGGVTAGVEDVIATIALPFHDGTPAPVKTDPTPWIVFIGFAGALLIGLRKRIADALVRLRRCPQCGRHGLRRSRKVIDKPTRSARGAGRLITRCTYCSYEDRQSYTLPRLGSSSSSGSFGGGSSGGGGATGRW